MGKSLSWIVMLLCAFSLAAVLYLGYGHSTYKTAMMDGQKAQLLQITRKAAQDLDRVAAEVMRSANHIAETLSAQEMNAEAQRRAEQNLKQMLVAHLRHAVRDHPGRFLLKAI